MEFRFAELTNELNEKFNLIKQSLDEGGTQFDIKCISPKQDFLPYERELIENPNKRRSESIAKYSDGKIFFSPLSSQMIWYIAWLAYLIKENQVGILDIDDFIYRLIEVDKGENKELSCKDLYAWDNKDLDSIFLYAMSFLICHELGHNVFHHPTPEYDIENMKWKNPELSRGNELQADSFAADCVTNISNNNEHEYELAVYGVIVAQIAILFIRNKEESYVIHPDPDTRLTNTLNDIDITPTMKRLIDYAKDMSEQYLERRFV